MRTLLPASLALGSALAAPALAADLTVDGQVDADVTVGTSTTISLSGGAALPAVLAYDIDPGPVSLFGESIPIGLTASFGVLAQGTTDGGGIFSVTIPILDNPGFVGQVLYLAGVLVDPGDPNLLDVSAGASITFVAAPVEPIEVHLAGKVRGYAPFFDWVGVVPQGEPLDVAVDTGRFPGLVGQTVDLYVTEDRDALGWATDTSLTDVTASGAETVTLATGDLTANTFTLDAGLLSGDGGASLGVAYDVVLDVNRNGQLDSGDLIDGGDDAAGIHVTRDPSQPGPYSVVEAVYTGGSFLGQNLFYPSDIDLLTDVPIVIVSHGNGHNYQWYDHIGDHLASYGYVVMSHQNNTIPGVASAATTTLTNTEFFLGNLDTIEGGVLDGHVDVHNITWIGHSRGGEGVVIAYDRIVDGTYSPVNFVADDIVLISSIAPVDFLGTNLTDPHDKPFHLWVGGADSDVTGCASSDIGQSYHLLGRAENQRQGISLNGTGHGDFHNGGGFPFATGPCLVGQAVTHGIMRGHLLPLLEFHMRGNAAGLDYLWRHYEDLSPQAAPLGNPCVVVNLQYREDLAEGRLVLDDFQTEPDDLIASSGATVTHDLEEWDTGQLNDSNTSFTDSGGDVFNGMTYANNSDPERGAVLAFSPSGGSFLAYDISAGDTDWSGFERLSFRACQTTRDTYTIVEQADVLFRVKLVDGDGDESILTIGNTETGVVEPYQRTSCGSGAGWGNEFETFRLGLAGFQANEPALDLDDIVRLEFLFGSPTNLGARLGLDDLELHVR